jgi:hypothetical protein
MNIKINSLIFREMTFAQETLNRMPRKGISQLDQSRGKVSEGLSAASYFGQGNQRLKHQIH